MAGNQLPLQFSVSRDNTPNIFSMSIRTKRKTIWKCKVSELCLFLVCTPDAKVLELRTQSFEYKFQVRTLEEKGTVNPKCKNRNSRRRLAMVHDSHGRHLEQFCGGGGG